MNEIQSIIVDKIVELAPDEKGKVHSDFTIFGANGAFDSVGLINLVVDLEEAINDQFGSTIVLADARAMSQKHSPFRTVQSLAEYIKVLLGEQQHV